jgi:hypothetical protein
LDGFASEATDGGSIPPRDSSRSRRPFLFHLIIPETNLSFADIALPLLSAGCGDLKFGFLNFF